MTPMVMVVGLIFAAAFAVTGLLLAAAGAGASQTLKQTLARLDAVSAGSKLADVDEVATLKREELLSSIPWFDRWLRSLDVFGRLRLLLLQADVSSTVGGLLLTTLGCWASGCGCSCICARKPLYRP